MAQSTQALLESLDYKIAEVLSEWGILTTLLALVILAFVAYPILYPDEPDTHPLLLARQSSAAPVRNKNESAAYRSPEVPYGYPLKTGLNVKDPGAPRWASGKDGDVRDIWREVQRGRSQDADGKPITAGSIMTVLGKEVVEHNIADITKEINIFGKHLADSGVKRVAIYLPNSVEYLTTIFGMLVEPQRLLPETTEILIGSPSMCFLRPLPCSASLQPATPKSLRIDQRHLRRCSRLRGR